MRSKRPSLHTLAYRTLASALAFLAVACVRPAAARADAGIGVEFGGQIPLRSEARDAGAHVRPEVGVSYDIIRPPIVPVRASLDFDYASGSRGEGKLDVFGLAASARLTTPLYVGGGLGLYDVAAHPADAAAPGRAVFGAGSDLFAGTRLLSLPGGLGVSLQFDYRALPSAAGISASGLSAGVRARF